MVWIGSNIDSWTSWFRSRQVEPFSDQALFICASTGQWLQSLWKHPYNGNEMLFQPLSYSKGLGYQCSFIFHMFLSWPYNFLNCLSREIKYQIPLILNFTRSKGPLISFLCFWRRNIFYNFSILRSAVTSLCWLPNLENKFWLGKSLFPLIFCSRRKLIFGKCKTIVSWEGFTQWWDSEFFIKVMFYIK
jgi:hypothetical protein